MYSTRVQKILPEFLKSFLQYSRCGNQQSVLSKEHIRHRNYCPDNSGIDAQMRRDTQSCNVKQNPNMEREYSYLRIHMFFTFRSHRLSVCNIVSRLIHQQSRSPTKSPNQFLHSYAPQYYASLLCLSMAYHCTCP